VSDFFSSLSLAVWLVMSGSPGLAFAGPPGSFPPGAVDETFHLDAALENSNQIPAYALGSVRVAATSLDHEKIYIGGMFDRFQGKPIGHNLARLLHDGSLDPSFDSGAGIDGIPYAIVADPKESGAIFVGGSFGKYQNKRVAALIHVHSDGSLDDSFKVRQFAIEMVSNLVFDAGRDQLYVLGMIGDEGRHWAPGIVRLKRDGSVDPSFKLYSDLFQLKQSALRRPPSVYGNRLLLSRSGKLYYAYTVESSFHRLARIDEEGYADPEFRRDAVHFDRSIDALAETADGQLYAAGAFQYGETASAKPHGWNIARLNPDGRLDTQFIVANANQVMGVASSVMTTPSEDGVYFAGGFASSPPEFLFGKLQTDGSMDPSVLAGDGKKGDFVNQMLLGKPGELYLVGSLRDYAGHALSGIVRLHLPK